MGYSRAGYLPRGPNQASEAARTTTPRRISGPAKDRLLGLQRAVGNQAVTRLLRPSQVPAQQSGKPLDPATRSRMESFLGADFSQVRVHTDGEAAQSASAINALAYTTGRDIVFAAGQYSPGTHAGRRMLAHELAHVVQQSSGPVDGSLVTGGIKLSDPSDRFEQEAELTAERVIAGRPVSTWTGGNVPASPSAVPALSVQRSNGSTPPPAPPPAPAPPDWLPASVRATAVHVQGDIWDVRLPSLGGRHWVGPHDQLQRFINRQGFGTAAHGEPLQAAHIVGTEHLLDIGSSSLDPKADGPSIAVPASLHSTWTTQTSQMQSRQGEMGGRATATEGRVSVGPKEVWGLYASSIVPIPKCGKWRTG